MWVSLGQLTHRKLRYHIIFRKQGAQSIALWDLDSTEKMDWTQRRPYTCCKHMSYLSWSMALKSYSQKQFVKHILSLPVTVADPAVYVLSGAIYRSLVISAHNHFGPWPFRPITISAHTISAHNLYIPELWFSYWIVWPNCKVLFPYLMLHSPNIFLTVWHSEYYLQCGWCIV